MKRSFLALALLGLGVATPRPSWAQTPTPALGLSAYLEKLTWAPGSGPIAAATSAALPTPQAPPTQAAMQEPPTKSAPQAPVQAAPAALPSLEVHHYFHSAAPVAAPVYAQPVVQAVTPGPTASFVPVQSTQTVIQPAPVYRKAGLPRRMIAGVARQVEKIGWDRQLIPPAQTVTTTTAAAPVMAAPAYYAAPPAPVYYAAPPAPMAPVKASPQQ